MKRTVSILVVATAVSLAPRAGAQSPGQTEHRTSDVQLLQAYRDANARLEKAKRHFEQKDLARARKEVVAGLERAPSFPEGHLLLAKICYLEKDFLQALAEIETAKKGWEKSMAFRDRMQQDRLSGMRKRAREKDDSIADLNARLSTTPPEAQQALQAQITQLRADKDEIERILQEPPSTGTEPPPEYFFIHGNVHLRMKSYNDAVMQYHEALRLKPDYADAANNLASVFYSARRFEQALAVIRKAESAGATINPELKKAIEVELAKPK